MTRYETNRKNFYEAASFVEPKKVPVGVNNFGWNFHYAGVCYKDIRKDPQKTARDYLKFYDEIEVDWAIMAMLPWCCDVWEALGSKSYVFGEDGNCVNHAQVNDVYFEDASVYDAIVEDVETFVNVTYPSLAFPALRQEKEQAYASYIKALKAYRTYMEASGIINQELIEKGVFNVMDDILIDSNSSFLKIFDNYRGIVNSMKDLRRHTDKVYDAVSAISAYKDKKAEATPEMIEDHAIAYTIYHAEGGFLNPKQFDNLYFNRIEETLIPFIEKGLKLCIYGEGHYMNTLDRFRRLPKGSVVLHLDEDDPFEVHKRIGDWVTLSCGITTDMLATASVEECKDYVKRCFDTFAPGGGFVFAPNKTLCSSKDAKIDNVVEVFKTANELSGQ